MIAPRRIAAAAGAAALVLAAAAGARALQQFGEAHAPVPTTRVARGVVSLDVHADGELRAGRTALLVAPPSSTSLRLVRLAPTGAAVAAGDVVMEFDPAEQQHVLAQSRSELDEAEQEIVKMRADTAVQAAQDRVALLTARFDVRRAELDVAGNEFVGAIDAQKNVLSLEEARRRLEQLEADAGARAATTQASLAVLEEKRHKAQLAMQRAQQAIDGLVVRAPLEGLVAVRDNRDAMGGMMFWGMVLPEYREGDTVFPGRAVAEVLEVDRMEIRARINEHDRANVVVGQPARVEVDALPGETFQAHIAALSALAARGSPFMSTGPTRQFDALFRLETADARLRAGASTRLVIEGDAIDGLHLPRQAVFERNGTPVVFVRDGGGFAPREVTIAHRTESRVVIEGLHEGTEVALVDPDSASARAAAEPPAGPVPGAGGGS